MFCYTDFVDAISISLVKLFGYRTLAVASQVFAVIGIVADISNLNITFLTATIFPVSMVIILIFINRKRAKK